VKITDIKGISLLCLLFLLATACKNAESASVSFPDGFSVRAQVARSPEQLERGLMFRDKLGYDEGMLFVLGEDAARAFWMKNTFIPLDIIFIDRQKNVSSVSKNMPRSYKSTPHEQVAIARGRGSYVLEVAAGTADAHNLKAGDILDFNL
jgi:uncharacterized membrane protein (UPF0127 family)